MSLRITTCPVCGARALQRIVGPFTFKRREQETTVPDVPRLRCSACGEELFDRESNRVISVHLGARPSRGAA